ncbi:hypothetical protein QC762_605730 [Podospora pseudocomata]|uniref:Ubiquitin-like domain-containing protein n=1 Tax=Podospora pseudocomata TaxID=2093779 RepID=A0ABR0G6M1_9PEZI|nr:hypothetical protein QC762_605730 [Podospora pseudocomata]
MTELAFAQSFLSMLGGIPSKITHDHVEDPRRYTVTTPYTLPHHPTLPKKFTRRTCATKAPPESITVTAVSPRNPPLSITLPSPLPVSTTSVLDIKNAISLQTGVPVQKIKLLHQKKPAQDSKTLKDVLAGEGKEQLELGLMIIGGAASVPEQKPPKQEDEMEVDSKEAEPQQQQQQQQPVAAPGQQSGREVLDTEEFWADLKGFLEQRVRDEGVAKEAVERFRLAWRS